MDFWVILFASQWFMLPAWLSDMSPTIFHGGGPLDRGKKWKRDGRRILGDGKSVFGSLGGTLTGLIIGLLQWVLLEIDAFFDLVDPFLSSDLKTGDLMFDYAFRGLLLGFGTILGDVSGSFIKRRLNFKRGTDAYFLDQLGFLVAALIVTLPFYSMRWEFIVVIFPVAFFGQLLFHQLGLFLNLKPVGDDPKNKKKTEE